MHSHAPNVAHSISNLPLPGFAGIEPKTYAPWPVWKDSTRTEVRFQPAPKKAMTRLWHRARNFDRQTKRKGRHGGAVGHTALQVLHALIFDFMNFKSGRLDPSYAAIARKANVCPRAVATAIARLKELGILNWLRRCKESMRNGRYVLEQDTNAYAILPSSQWRGYREPPEAPPPEPDTWGACPPLPPVVDQAADALKDGATLQQTIRTLGSDPSDELGMALAVLGQTVADCRVSDPEALIRELERNPNDRWAMNRARKVREAMANGQARKSQ